MNTQVNDGDDPDAQASAISETAGCTVTTPQSTATHLAANALLTALHHGQVRTFPDVARLGLLEGVDPAEVAFGLAIQLVTTLRMLRGRGLNIDKTLAGTAASTIHRTQADEAPKGE